VGAEVLAAAAATKVAGPEQLPIGAALAEGRAGGGVMVDLVPAPRPPTIGGNKQGILVRIDNCDPDSLRALAQRAEQHWLRSHQTLQNRQRLTDRIAFHLETLSVTQFVLALRWLGYQPGTMREYAGIAASLTPGYRESPEGRSIFKDLELWTNQAKILQPEVKFITIPQLRQLLSGTCLHLRAAVWVTWITASRIGDWPSVDPIFHPNEIELRYTRRWKSDDKLKRRLSKWIYRGSDTDQMWNAAIALLINDPNRVRRYIKFLTGATGHAIRHSAIKQLEVLGQTTEQISHLTFHVGTQQHFPTLERYYLALWTPREAYTSMVCLAMSQLLRQSVGM
jgi:hypothetical protein